MTAPLVPMGGLVLGGRYAVASVIARRDSYVTYRATAEDGREVILKVLDPALRFSTDLMSGIDRCEEITNALPSEMVIRISDRGYEEETGAPCLVMELAKFPALSELVALCHLPVADMVTVIVNLARILDAAHALGMVHGSLKPTNVFVSGAPDYDVRVGDFGASALSRHACGAMDPWTAPEQMKGAEAGAEADVFATALLAFYAVTGHSYFRANGLHPAEVAVLRQQILGPRAPASVRARELGVTLDPACDEIFARALAIDPAERFRSVGAFAAALADALDPSETVTSDAPPVSTVSDAPPELITAPFMVAPRPRAPSVVALEEASDEIVAPFGEPSSDSMMEATPATWLEEEATDATEAMAEVTASDAPPAPPLETVREATSPSLRAATLTPIPPPSAGARSKSAMIALTAAAAVVLLTFVGWMQAAGRTGSESVAVASSPISSAAPSVPELAPPGIVVPDRPDALLSAVCDPACDSVYIDGELASGDSRRVAPGVHVVTANKALHASQTKRVTVSAGEEQTLMFAFVQAAPVPPPQKKCGKFLKRCN